jgi:hypothetical protein
MLIESRIDREQANVAVTMTIYPDFPVQLLIWSGGIGSTSTLLGR